MKRRISDSEIENAKKSSRRLFLISFVLLILLFVSFGALYAFNVDIISFFKVPKEKLEKTERKVKQVVMDPTPIALELDVNDNHIQRFFDIVKVTNYDVCLDGGYKDKEMVDVNKLSTNCKFSLASKIYEEKVDKTLEGKLYVKEEDVRRGYEELFGNGTYERQEQIPCLYKTNFMFRDDYYFTEKVANEEGTSLTSYEKVIKAYREGENLDITSAVLYHERVLNLFCRDSNCNDVIEKTKSGEYDTEYLDLYVEHNKNKLYQYTYHFKMDDAGFYHYLGYTRTNLN